MRVILSLIMAVGIASQSHAASVKSGPDIAVACAACHGGNGVSVSAKIPNLAGQKAKYVEGQLKAFRDGKRKSKLMNAIAGQLTDENIATLAGFFSSLPGATGTETSAMPANITETRIRFPADYRKQFKRYTTINFAKKKQVRHYYANQAALTAAGSGKPLPDGSILFVEIYKAKLDDAKKPVKGSDGNFVGDKIAAYTAMEKQPGWGKGFPDILRNGDWNYAVFTADKSLKKGVNQARCLACHKPLAGDSYVFSLKQLQRKAKTK